MSGLRRYLESTIYITLIGAGLFGMIYGSSASMANITESNGPFECNADCISVLGATVFFVCVGGFCAMLLANILKNEEFWR